MSDHLSALALDELAAGLTPDEPAHLATCAPCRDRLAALRAANATFLAQPKAKAQLDRLAPPRRLPWGRLVALPLAAALALFVLWPRPPTGDLIKGAPTVVLLDAAGNVVKEAKPGQRLDLAVGAPGFHRVTVYATGPDGKREQLYSGAIGDAARTTVMQLEVTPGDVEVTAEFEDGARHALVSTHLKVP